jgi:hypothetical protein
MESAVPTPTPVPPTPAPEAKSLGWVAAPVVGGCALVALVAAVGYWIAKRRAAQAMQGKSYAADEARGDADDRDGGTPTGAQASNGSARAQASLN